MPTQFKRTIPVSFVFIIFLFAGCSRAIRLQLPVPPPNFPGGSELFRNLGAMNWKEREPIIEKEILSGNVPGFLKKFVQISTFIFDSATKKTIRASYYVAPDYLSVGNSEDWVRIPITPMTAQRIADSLDCFLPTRKMVDEIYSRSTVKLEPVPLYAFRDSAIIFWHHHLIIEGQRKNRKGLISGIKKDVVISDKITRNSKTDRVAIYGWHKPDGKPIQPLYGGHVNWYVDYSHGIRLIYRKIKVNGRWMDYEEVLKHSVYRRLLCDEKACDVSRYPTN